MIDERRKLRLGVNDYFRSTYNNADFPQLLKVCLDYCDPNLKFIAPKLIQTNGVYRILAFFMLVNEIFPDSNVKNIEKRIATIKLPTITKPSFHPPPEVTTETVEIIDKFVGTRVLDKAAVDIYLQIVQSDLIKENTVYSLSELSQILATKLYSDELPAIGQPLPQQSTALGRVVTFITETKLTFDLRTNKIVVWDYSILAVHS
jgi:hypothetical protein